MKKDRSFLGLLKKTIKKIAQLKQDSYPDVVEQACSGVARGNVLLSYLRKPLTWKSNDERFAWHSNCWESCEIARIFNELRFNVDVIEWSNLSFYPQKKYDIIFDISQNLQRLAPLTEVNTLKILHITGSYPFYQRTAELARIDQLELRTGMLYSPKRISPHLDWFERSLRLANVCSLIGNEHTLTTFPEEYREKISFVTVSASFLNFIKKEANYITKERDFLYFYGSGAVHKGLDLLLDIFAQEKKYNLHIVTNLNSEPDFLKIYEKVLNDSQNIFYHGALAPSSKEFIEIIKKCMYFIAPSCSEAISASVATCLQIGLYPILSKDNGVSLPMGVGIILKNCTGDEIKLAIKKVYEMDDNILFEHIKTCQAYALHEFSRDRFTEKMQFFLERSIENHFKKIMR